jgi:hypothetical protein
LKSEEHTDDAGCAVRCARMNANPLGEHDATSHFPTKEPQRTNDTSITDIGKA